MSYLESRKTRSRIENRQMMRGIAILLTMALTAAILIVMGIFV